MYPGYVLQKPAAPQAPQLPETSAHPPTPPTTATRVTTLAHTRTAHARVSVDGPVQGAPHALPRIQLRDLVCVPVPQATEHALQAPNPVHLE